MLLIVAEIWAAKEMAGDGTKWGKAPYFHCVAPLIRIENIKERWKKIER